MTGWPVYEFGSYFGPVDTWFAWRPVKLWWGKWVWLRRVERRRVVKHYYLPGPEWQFWAYR